MLEHFELINFIFIAWVPSIHQVMVWLEIYRLVPLLRLNKFQFRKPNILLAFMQTLFTWLFHFISWVVVRPSYLASYNDSSGWPWRVLLKLIGFLFWLTDRISHLSRQKAIFHFPSHIARLSKSCCALIVDFIAIYAMVSSANSRMVKLRWLKYLLYNTVG